MDWQMGMNKAIDYIENNLSDEIDYDVAAQTNAVQVEILPCLCYTF